MRLLEETNIAKCLKRPHEGTMSPREWTFLNRRPCHGIKKVASLLHFILKWQGMRESNSQQWFWRPLLYHLTNPLKDNSILQDLSIIVNNYFVLLFEMVSTGIPYSLLIKLAISSNLVSKHITSIGLAYLPSNIISL